MEPNHAPLDRGCRLISATGQVEYDDDPELPWKIVVNLRPPEFMQVTFIMLHGGSEEVIVRGQSLRAIADFLRRNPLQGHPRFRWLEVTGPDSFKLRRTHRKMTRWT